MKESRRKSRDNPETKRKSFESYPSQAQNEYDNLIDNTQKYSDRDIDQDIEKEHPQLINKGNMKLPPINSTYEKLSEDILNSKMLKSKKNVLFENQNKSETEKEVYEENKLERYDTPVLKLAPSHQETGDQGAIQYLSFDPVNYDNQEL